MGATPTPPSLAHESVNTSRSQNCVSAPKLGDGGSRRKNLSRPATERGDGDPPQVAGLVRWLPGPSGGGDVVHAVPSGPSAPPGGPQLGPSDFFLKPATQSHLLNHDQSGRRGGGVLSSTWGCYWDGVLLSGIKKEKGVFSRCFICLKSECMWCVQRSCGNPCHPSYDSFPIFFLPQPWGRPHQRMKSPQS